MQRFSNPSTSPTSLPVNREAFATEDDRRKRAILANQKEDIERT